MSAAAAETAAALVLREAVAVEAADAAREGLAPPAADGASRSLELSAANRRRLRLPAALWIAGTVADQVTTYKFSSEYGDLLHEKNLLISGLQEHPALLVAVGTAFDAATGWLTYRFLGSKHPRIAQLLFYSAAAYRSYLAVHNAQMMQQAREFRALAAPVLPR
jgi:hypothetical protein